MSNSIYQQTERNLAALKMHQMKIHLEEVANTVGNDNLSSYNIFVSKILALLKQIFLIRIS